MFVAKIFKDHGNTEIIGLTDQKTSKGTFFIYLTITHKREVRYISIGYEIDDLFQFDKGTVVCRKDAKVMNQRLDYVLSEYQEKLDSIDHQERFSCAQIKEMLENKKNADNTITIKDFMERRISDFRKEGRNSYADMNEYTLKKILSIIGNIPLSGFTTSTIDKFMRGMSDLRGATRQMRLSHLKARINEAIREGIVRYDIHPFSFVKMPKSPAKTLDITINEFRRILDMKTRHRRLSLARDIFLLSFYLGGMNLADMVNARFDGNTVSYVRPRIKGREINPSCSLFPLRRWRLSVSIGQLAGN